MRITFFNDFEARIVFAVAATVQQTIFEARIAAAVWQTLHNLNF